MWAYVFISLGYIPKSRIAKSYGNSTYNPLRTARVLFKAAAWFYIPISRMWGFKWLYIFTNTYYPSFLFLINWLIYLWLCWVFASVRGPSPVAASGGHSSLRCARRASHYHGLSCCGAQAQTRRLSNCGSRAQLLSGMWDLPRPGLEPVSPALAGRLPTTAPPGKPYPSFWF